ncbi:MAG: adenosylhomocysteinase, partial [Candidatus Nanohaloarchaea archaeon]|nr:adenosylhomocysteinase [Candidatus Nanohaloarchaea archaeon]
SLEKILRTRFEDELAGSDVLVTGYGNIGSSTAAAAQGRNATVMVYDTDPRRSIEAALDGYHVRERERMLRQADIVIGTTGQQSVDIDDMRSMEGTVILASGSSKQREFDIERLRREASLKDSGSHWEEYQLDGTSIILLNGGKPVNFLDQSISMPILDMIFASLVTCIHEAVQHELQPGLQEPDQERLDSIAETWLHAYQYSGELQ